MSWSEQAEAAVRRYEGGRERELDQRQLTQLANAAWAAGMCLLMDGRRDDAARWLRQAAMRYHESWSLAPPDSWGRPIAAMKALLLASGDARSTANWSLEKGAARSESPIGRYAGTLALLVLGRDEEARALASTLRERHDFPRDVADALATVAASDRVGYLVAVEDVLESFEQREEFLEDVAVADTVLVLQILAAARECAVDLPRSSRLPSP
ncbi:MAG: hypothetical protein ACRDL2_07825 [Gaiellaceae bacterium]